MVTHSSTLAWEIPWTERPGGLQLTGSRRVGDDLATEQQQSLAACRREKGQKQETETWPGNCQRSRQTPYPSFRISS